MIYLIIGGSVVFLLWFVWQITGDLERHPLSGSREYGYKWNDTPQQDDEDE